jgi:hypothetical protein
VQDGTDRAIVHARLRDVTGTRSGGPESGARSHTQVRYVLARSGGEWRVIEVRHRWQ